ncbi:MAG: N-acetylmuramoyl-L-alanine amidase [Candidatus Aldehydirespiratoraceae bacterium]|jgi:N-acetylmuramoyl-L-alanine amidase
MRVTLAAIVAATLIASACSDDPSLPGASEEVIDTVVTESTASVDTPSTSTDSITTLPVADRLPPLAVDVAGAIRSSDGSGLAVSGSDGEVWFVIGACRAEAVEPAATAETIDAKHVVLDPGSSDDLAITRHNRLIAEEVARLLSANGVSVSLTREFDQPMSESARGALGPALGARAVVSIHHEYGDEVATVTRPTVFHQIDDVESRRLAGLLHQETEVSLAEIGVGLAAAVEPGVRPLLNQRGQNFFVVLQVAESTPAARLQITVLPENDMSPLVNEEARALESQAIADAIVRFLVTDEEGNGFVEPIETVRAAPTSHTPGGCGEPAAAE